MTRSTKEKNFSARASLEKSFENTFLTPKKNKYIVQEKNKTADLPKSTQPTYVSVRSNTNDEKKNSKEKEYNTKPTQPISETVPKTNKPIYVSIRRSSKPKVELVKKDDKPSIEDIINILKESKILDVKENREELLLLINNFIEFKQ